LFHRQRPRRLRPNATPPNQSRNTPGDTYTGEGRPRAGKAKHHCLPPCGRNTCLAASSAERGLRTHRPEAANAAGSPARTPTRVPAALFSKTGKRVGVPYLALGKQRWGFEERVPESVIRIVFKPHVANRGPLGVLLTDAPGTAGRPA
jgi:hypothetical protein